MSRTVEYRCDRCGAVINNDPERTTILGREGLVTGVLDDVLTNAPVVVCVTALHGAVPIDLCLPCVGSLADKPAAGTDHLHVGR